METPSLPARRFAWTQRIAALAIVFFWISFWNDHHDLPANVAESLERFDPFDGAVQFVSSIPSHLIPSRSLQSRQFKAVQFKAIDNPKI